MPLLCVLAFAALAAVTTVLDRSTASWLPPIRQALTIVLPPQQNESMLRTLAPGMLTVMSISFFLFLTLVQRMSGTFTWVVVEQFLLRRTNQAFFGFYAGLMVYYVAALAVVGPPQALFTTTAALVLSVVALIGLVVFGYLVLDQLRPTSVVERIVRVTLATRAAQVARLRHLRNAPRLGHLPAATVCAPGSGYLVDIDLDKIADAVSAAADAAEVELYVGVGTHLVMGRPVAAVRAEKAVDRQRLGNAVLDALKYGRERKLESDAVYGVHQLSSIAWAAASAREPEAAMVAVAGMETLLADWARDDRSEESRAQDAGGDLPLIYPDTTVEELLSSLSSVIVASSSSGQYQTCAEVLNVFALALPQLSPGYQSIAVTQLRPVLPLAAKHSFTVDLQHALGRLARVLREGGHQSLAAHLSGIESRMADALGDGRQQSHSS